MRLVAGEYIHRLIEMGAVITWVQDTGAKRTLANEQKGSAWPAQQKRYSTRFERERCDIAVREGRAGPLSVRVQSSFTSVQVSRYNLPAVDGAVYKPHQLAKKVWGHETGGPFVMEAACADVRARLHAAGIDPSTCFRTVHTLHADAVVMHEAEQLAALYGEAFVVSPDTDLLILAAASPARVGIVLMGVDDSSSSDGQWGCKWKTQGLLPHTARPAQALQRGSACQLDFTYCLPGDLAKEWRIPEALLPLAAVCFGTDDTDTDMTLQLHSALLQQILDSEDFTRSFRVLSLNASGKKELYDVARAKSAGGERKNAHQYCAYGAYCRRYACSIRLCADLQ
jgi:hypothetical protein